jgi:hypothetical protein
VSATVASGPRGGARQLLREVKSLLGYSEEARPLLEEPGGPRPEKQEVRSEDGPA